MHGVHYFCTHKPKVPGSSVTFTIEILERDYAGSAIEVFGVDQVFTHEYEHIDEERILEDPIQKARLEFFLYIDNDTGYNGLSILETIFASQEGDYLLRKKVNGAVEWVGSVLPGMMEYSEGPYPFPGKIVSKDLNPLEGKDFPLFGAPTYKSAIGIVGNALNELEYNIPLHCYNDFSHDGTGAGDDALDEAYHDQYHLRDYVEGGDDQPISKLSAIGATLKPYGCILRQQNGAWEIVNIAYAARQGGQNLTRHEYDISGALPSRTGTSTVNNTAAIDRVSRYSLPSSTNRATDAMKSITLNFNHKTRVGGLEFDPTYTNLDINDTKVASQSIDTDGTQRLKLSGRVRVSIDNPSFDFKTGTAKLTLEAGQYTYNNTQNTWTTTAGKDIAVSVAGSGSVLGGSIPINETSPIPDDADNIVVTFRWATINDGTTVTEVEWVDFNGNMSSNTQVDESASKGYQVTQSGAYSNKYHMGTSIFGIGPTDNSRSAIRYLATNFIPTTANWTHGGDPAGRDILDLLLVDMMSLYRTPIRNIDMDLWGDYNPASYPVYKGDIYFFLGGRQDGKDGIWGASSFLKITSILDGADLLDEWFGGRDGGPSFSGISGDTANLIIKSFNYISNQKITEITADLSGTINSIPIDPVQSSFLDLGDEFYIFDIEDASVTSFVAAALQTAGDSSIPVEAKTISGTIPEGSWVVFTGEKIGSYISRTDQAIRLGVRGYSPANLNGADWKSGDTARFGWVDGVDQDALDGYTTSELAILKGQLVLKTTGAGGLALVRLDSTPDTGSLIEIKAAQIELESLVTRINSENVTINADTTDITGIVNLINAGSGGEITGGILNAESKITVGTGTNVAVLDGVHASYRIYAGNADPTIAPFRVTQDGLVLATAVAQLSSSDGTGYIDNLELRSLSVTDTITVDTGEIKTIDTKNFGGNDFDVTTSVQNGEILLTLTDTVTSVSQTASFSASTDTSSMPQLEINRTGGAQSQLVGGSLVLTDTTDATKDLFLSADSISFGSAFLDTSGRTGLTEFIKVLVDGNVRYIKLYF